MGKLNGLEPLYLNDCLSHNFGMRTACDNLEPLVRATTLGMRCETPEYVPELSNISPRPGQILVTLLLRGRRRMLFNLGFYNGVSSELSASLVHE